MEWTLKVNKEEEKGKLQKKIIFMNDEDISIRIRVDREYGWKFIYIDEKFNFPFLAYQEQHPFDGKTRLNPALGLRCIVDISSHSFPLNISEINKQKITKTIESFLLNFRLFKGAKPPHVEQVIFTEKSNNILNIEH